jgi:hypothetical protein
MLGAEAATLPLVERLQSEELLQQMRTAFGTTASVRTAAVLLGVRTHSSSRF